MSTIHVQNEAHGIIYFHGDVLPAHTFFVWNAGNPPIPGTPTTGGRVDGVVTNWGGYGTIDRISVFLGMPAIPGYVTQVKAAAVLSAGAELAASGTEAVAASTGETVVGIALQAASAVGDVVWFKFVAPYTK